MLLLGIDCGTQGLKIIAWDSEAHRIWAASRSYDLTEGLPPGHKEQHPRIWIDALENCVAALQGQQGLDLSRVKGIGVSGRKYSVNPSSALCLMG